MKISKLNSNSIFASKEKDEKVTLFLNKATETVCYKNENNEVKEIGNGVSEILALQSKIVAPLYSEINISSTEILNAQTIAIPLVSILVNKANPFTKYRKDLIMCFEFTEGSIPYEEAIRGGLAPSISTLNKGKEEPILSLDNLNIVNLSVFTEGTIQYQIIKYSDILDAFGIFDEFAINFSTPSALINGNGTLKVKIYDYIENVG